MEIWQIILLAIVQGLTEFLPISSSAHLVLFPHLFGLQDQGLAFDVALHMGSLIAVMWYFRKDLHIFITHALQSIRSRNMTQESLLAWGVLLGTLPVGIVGFIVVLTNLDEQMRSPIVVGCSTLFFGTLLGLADWFGTRQRTEADLTWRDIAIISCAQAFAVIPGTSRSGATMTAGLFIGLQRKTAARFSFLLSIPAIILTGLGEGLFSMLKAEHVSFHLHEVLLGITFSAISAYFCIKFFINLLDKIGMLPFVIYRLILGVVLLTWMS